MARGVWTSGESQAEAEASVEVERHQVRIVSCREIDLSGLPPLPGGPLPRHWVAVVEDLSEELAAARPQQEDPEEETERFVRRLYLTMATDPQLLSSGTIEEFPCPSCGEEVRIELPPAREKAHPGHFSCPHCRAHLRLADAGARWEVAPPRIRRDGRCVFCGAEADSFEHVIPKWIGKQLGVKDIIPVRGMAQAPGREARTRPISFASYRAQVFCGPCNTHFKHLEDEVVPVIVPMARGRILSFGAGLREILARWCLKTAIALLSAEPGDQDAVPMEHRRALRERGEIAAGTWIGIFRWSGSPLISGGRGMIRNESRGGSDADAYSALLAFEGFGFYVTAFADSPAHPDPPACDHPPMLGIWPPRLGFTNWPPLVTDERVLPAKLFSGWTPLQIP